MYVIKQKDLYLHDTGRLIFLPTKDGALVFAKEEAEICVATLSKGMQNIFKAKIKKEKYIQGKPKPDNIILKKISDHKTKKAKNQLKKDLEKNNG
jgi:hypothetical protein